MATATNTTVTITDDLDGKTGATTVNFSVEGTDYTIDLGGLNLKNFRTSLQKYIDAARVVEAPKAKRGKRGTATAKPASDAAVIREWARANGIEVGERGRLNPQVVEAYKAAQVAEVPAPAEA